LRFRDVNAADVKTFGKKAGRRFSGSTAEFKYMSGNRKSLRKLHEETRTRIAFDATNPIEMTLNQSVAASLENLLSRITHLWSVITTWLTQWASDHFSVRRRVIQSLPLKSLSEHEQERTFNAMSSDAVVGTARDTLLARFGWESGHADIWQVFLHGPTFTAIIAGLVEPWRDAGITHIAGIESWASCSVAPLRLTLALVFRLFGKPWECCQGAKST